MATVRWRNITKEDIAAQINQDEIDAYSQLPEFSSMNDPIEDLIIQVSAYVRGFCRASGVVKIDAEHENTVPVSLVKPAVSIIVYRLLSRMPLEVIESRKKDWETAEDLLKKVANKEFVPESYGIEDTTDYAAIPMCGFSVRPNFTLRGSPSNPTPYRRVYFS